MRPLAVTLGVVYLVVNAFAALLMWFYATFPFENQSSEDRGKDDWLIAVASAMFLLALLTVIAVIARRHGWGAVTFAANSAVALAVLRWGLGVSDHSDGKLIAFALGIELTGLGAVVLWQRRLSA
jgi:hypothetical protein